MKMLSLELEVRVDDFWRGRSRSDDRPAGRLSVCVLTVLSGTDLHLHCEP